MSKNEEIEAYSCYSCFFCHYASCHDESYCDCEDSEITGIIAYNYFCDKWLDRKIVSNKIEELEKKYSFLDYYVLSKYAVKIIGESLYWSNNLGIMVNRELSQDFVDKINAELAEENEKSKQLRKDNIKKEIQMHFDKIKELEKYLNTF